MYDAVRTLDLRESKITHWLLLLRGLPDMLRPSDKRKEHSDLTLDGLLKAGGFVFLGERPQQELLLGVVGRFWRPGGNTRRMDAAEFMDFEEQGYAKAVWNFSFSQQADGITCLITETRVYCTDAGSRQRFRIYWLFIRPFKGNPSHDRVG